MEKAVIVAVLALVLVSGVAAAAPSNVQVSPQVVWLDESNTFKVMYDCGANETGTSVYLTSTYGTTPCSTPVLESGKWASTCYLLQNNYGAYDVTVECSGGKSSNLTVSSGVVANKLFLTSSFSGPAYYYTKDIMSGVRVSFKLNNNPLGFQDSPSLNLYLVDSSGFPISLDMYPATYDYPDIVLSGRIPEIPAGTYDLKVVGTYQGHKKELVIPSAVNVKPSFSLEITSQTDFKISGASVVSVSLKASERNQPLKGLTEDNFILKIFDKDYDQVASLVPQEVSYDQATGNYVVKFSIPELLSNKYTGYIVLNYGGTTIQPDKYINIEVVVPFRGSFVDSRGNSLTGEIRLTNPEIGVFTIQPSASGTFESSVLPGNYTMEVSLPGFRAVMDGVLINSAVDEPFRFDVGSSGQQVTGIKTAKLVVFEFALPFTQAQVEIQYDDSLVYDEQKIEVYTCKNWNYGRRSCSGTWERVDSPRIDPVRNRVLFNTTHFSAFVVGERKHLYFSVDLQKKSFYRGEPVSITGKVVDESEAPVEDATVYYEFEGTNITGTGVTDAAGYFSILAYAPNSEGSFKLLLRAEKSPYVETEVSTILSVYSKAEATIRAPETVVADIGDKVNFSIEVTNTGQKDLGELKVSVSGMNSKWFDYTPEYLDIPVGETKKVVVTIRIDPEDCKVEECKNFYFLRVGVSNEAVSAEKTVTVKVSVPESQTKQTPGISISGNAVRQAGQWLAGLAIIGIFAAFVLFGKRRGSSQPSLRVKPKPSGDMPSIDRIRKIKTTLKVREDFKIDDRKFRFRRK